MTRDLLFLALVLLACTPPADPASEEWARIAEMERDWRSSPGESRLDARQQWLDELRSFVENHPQHAAAALRYDDEEADFAIQLAANGRYAEAVEHYESVLSRNPDHGAARRGLEMAQRFVDRDEAFFSSLVRGDSPEAVSQKVGLPRSGWTRNVANTELWYYELAGGRTLAVRFVDGSFRGLEFPAPANGSAGD